MTIPASSTAPIIVRLPNWVGDVCMSLPCLAVLAQTGHPLMICGRSWAKDLVAQFKPQQFVPLTGKYLSDQRAIRAIPRATRRQALGLILPDSLSSAALFALAAIRSAGYRDDGRSLLLRWPISKPNDPVHATQKWALLTAQALQTWGIGHPFLTRSTEPNLPNPKTSPSESVDPFAAVRLELNEPDQRAALSALAAHGIKPQDFVLLAPTATGTHHGKVKIWPHFGELARQLKHQGTQIVTCPPAHERDQARQTCPDAVLLDPLSLRSFCALTKLANVVVCNDSGVSHLAAAAGANQLTLFGVTDPAITRPWSDQAHWLGTNGAWPSLEDVIIKVQQIQRHTPQTES